MCLIASGCPSNGIYSKLTPAYDLTANQDKKIFVWIESPRSAAADVDAAGVLAGAIRDHLVVLANVKSDNILLAGDSQDAPGQLLQSPEAAALQAGATLSLFVRIEDYELLPMNIRNFHSGRMTTRAILLDAETGQPLWPLSRQGKVHEIAIELGRGERSEILSRMAIGTAHCILRNLYPIMKLHYKTSDERVSPQEVFELETF